MQEISPNYYHAVHSKFHCEIGTYQQVQKWRIEYQELIARVAE